MVTALAALAATVGCKRSEEELLDRSIALNERVYQVLEEHVDRPQAAVEALQRLEEQTREEREALRRAYKEARAKLDEAARKALDRRAEKRSKELQARFATLMKRFPADVRPMLQQWVFRIVH